MNAAAFRKEDPRAHPDYFAAEAAGLRWLMQGGGPTVRVLSVGSDHIELERLGSAAPTATAAREFGARLARMHDAGARGFGCAPDGFGGQIFIGRRPMSSVVHSTWGEFYVNERVLPFVWIAVDAGSVTPDQLVDIDRACGMVATGVFDDADGPARIHGDLWHGNVLWTPDGVVLIDPAAHGGHRETDLAMLELFGCPHLGEVIRGYTDTHPLRRGWQARIALHQLHPLAVHAAGYGAGYGRALHRAALDTVKLGERA